MGSTIRITLDTTAPEFTLTGGGSTAEKEVSLIINCAEAVGTGKIFAKIWGDVDTSFNPDIQTAEDDSSWFQPTAWQEDGTGEGTANIKLSADESIKTLHVRLRDDVFNQTEEQTVLFVYDATLPTADVISQPSKSIISTITGHDTAVFTFSVSEAFLPTAEIYVVPAESSAKEEGTKLTCELVYNKELSTETETSTEYYPEDTVVTATVTATNLRAASAADGEKILKIFVQDKAGNWSV